MKSALIFIPVDEFISSSAGKNPKALIDRATAPMPSIFPVLFPGVENRLRIAVYDRSGLYWYVADLRHQGECDLVKKVVVHDPVNKMVVKGLAAGYRKFCSPVEAFPFQLRYRPPVLSNQILYN